MVVVQAVLLFGPKTWVLTHQLEKYLEDFHHQAVRRMSGMVPKYQWDGIWVYPPIEVEPEMVGLDEISMYIFRHQNTVAQYIANCPIMDLCLAAERKTGLRLYRRR